MSFLILTHLEVAPSVPCSCLSSCDNFFCYLVRRFVWLIGDIVRFVKEMFFIEGLVPY